MRVLSFATLVGLGLAALSVSAASQCPIVKLEGTSPFPGDKFGRSLSVDGNQLLVGSWLFASLFVRDDHGTPVNAMDDTWTLQTVLQSKEPGTADNYGLSVWLEADHLAVSAPASGGQFAGGPGAVFIYRRVPYGPSPLDDIWVEQAHLLPLETGPSVLFGSSVCLSEGYAAVGAMGEHLASQGSSIGTVHVYRRDDNGTDQDASDDTWLEQAVLVSSDHSTNFGQALRMDGKRLLVGAPGGAGAVYEFRREEMGTPADPADDVWVEQAKLTPPDASSVFKFGGSLDFDGSALAVGAWSTWGRAYLFRLNDNETPFELADDSWSYEATLAGSDVATNAYGSAVAVSGDTVLVGDPLKDEGAKWGAVYVFRKGTEDLTPADQAWTEVVKLVSPGEFAQKFGAAVRLDSGHAFVGEIGSFSFLTTDSADTETGTVWPFAIATPPWSFVDAALAGTGNPPCLVAFGTLEPDTTTVVSAHHDLRNAQTAFVIGFAALYAPFKGGVLVPQPSAVAWVGTNTKGDVTLNARWPSGVASGTNLFIQAWTVDIQGPVGLSATNGIRGVTP